jgi:hypothetical protein
MQKMRGECLMKKRALFIIAIMLTSILILSVSCIEQKSKWQGTIEELDGVTLIKNPKEPIYKEDIFSLEEELLIGEAESKDEYMFSQVIDVDVDYEGRIYILDSREAHIVVFDKKGKYLATIGRKGQGPGEMQKPQSIQITPQKEIMVNDMGARKLLFFNFEGKFVKGVSTAKMTYFNNPVIDSKNNIIANITVPGMKMQTELKKFDPELEPIFTIDNIELFKLPVMKAFFPQFFWQLGEDDSLIWGISSKYELQVMNSEGKLYKKIIKEYDPKKITEEDRQKEVKFLFGDKPVPPGVKLEWPESHGAFKYISIDEDGRIFLRTFEKTKDGSGYYYDVFNSEGKYIAKIPLKIKPQVWKKNKLYTIKEDEDGYQYVRRCSVTWKIN